MPAAARSASAVACGPTHRSGSVDPTTRPLEQVRRDAPWGESLADPAAVLEQPDTERPPSRVRLENAPRTRCSPFRANGLSGETFMSRERIRNHGFDLSGLEATSRVCPHPGHFSACPLRLFWRRRLPAETITQKDLYLVASGWNDSDGDGSRRVTRCADCSDGSQYRTRRADRRRDRG